MKRIFLLLALFTSSFAFGQINFNDSNSVNSYIRENIRDQRPAKLTADMLRNSLLSVSYRTSIPFPKYTLQKVLDSGATASNKAITITGNGTNSYIQLISSGATSNGWVKLGTADGLPYLELNPTGGTYHSWFRSNSLSANRNYYFPNKSGTVAMTDDIPVQSVNGNTGAVTVTLNNAAQQNNTVQNNNINIQLESASSISDDAHFKVFTPNTEISFGVNAEDEAFIKGTNPSGSAGIIKFDNLTDIRFYQLPDQDGELAIKKYKILSGILFQHNSETPTFNVLQNDLNLEFHFVRAAAGSYRLELETGTFNGLTWVFVQNNNSISRPGREPYLLNGQIDDDVTFIFETFKMNTGTLSFDDNVDNGLEYGVYFELRGYPQ